MVCRQMRLCVGGLLVAAVLTVSALAAEPTGVDYSVVQTAFQVGFQTIVDRGLSMIAMMVPIALGLTGVLFLVRRALSWFKGLAK